MVSEKPKTQAVGADNNRKSKNTVFLNNFVSIKSLNYEKFTWEKSLNGSIWTFSKRLSNDIG